MSFVILLGPLVILAVGALASGLAGRSERAGTIGVAAAILGGLPTAVLAAWVLASGENPKLDLPWSVPLGSLSLAIDALSAWFMLAIAVVCMLAAIYGRGYLSHAGGDKNLGVSWMWYLILMASMLLVTMARNGALFLVAWEVMSLSSFFLVMFDHEKSEVRQAGWTYLVATHLGTAFLLAMFCLLSGPAGTMDFATFASPASQRPTFLPAMFSLLPGPAGTFDFAAIIPPTSQVAASAVFLLAVIGFGTKAGIMPMHVWLPEAHPAAPSHVSAVMSGVMIKTGIYGLLRTLTLLGTPPTWWGWTLVGVGAATGIIGVLMALTQHDLKRLLAYSSVENIGIICMGIGLGVLGIAAHMPALAVLGLAGALLHVWNHAIFKSLLFLGAGSVVHATGTRNIEVLGGLMKKMPTTATTFIVASAAICGLPPLNGFVSELMIYVGAFAGIAGLGSPGDVAMAGSSWGMGACLLAIAAMAMIGGLAAACFTKAFGTVFLGEPRTEQAAAAHEAPRTMRGPMIVLAALCLAVGLLGGLALKAAQPVLQNQMGGVIPADAQAWLDVAWTILWKVSLGGCVVMGLAAGLAILRRRLLASRSIESAGTWDCGYVAPTARMQYTASSFGWPIVTLFRWLLRPAIRDRRPEGLFPSAASVQSRDRDIFEHWGYRPIFGLADWLSGRLQWLQQGRNQLYILYIAMTLLVLLVWKLG